MKQLILAAMLLLGSVPAGLAQDVPVTEGEVLEVDLHAGLVTIRHGPIRNLGMTASAATDTFTVADAVMLNAVRPGEKIKFTAETVNGTLTLTSLRP